MCSSYPIYKLNRIGLSALAVIEFLLSRAFVDLRFYASGRANLARNSAAVS